MFQFDTLRQCVKLNLQFGLSNFLNFEYNRVVEGMVCILDILSTWKVLKFSKSFLGKT